MCSCGGIVIPVLPVCCRGGAVLIKVVRERSLFQSRLHFYDDYQLSLSEADHSPHMQS